MWCRKGQGYLNPFLPPAWPEYLSHPAGTVLDISQPVFLTLTGRFWVTITSSPCCPLSSTKITSGKSLPKCFFRVKIRVAGPYPEVLGTWVLLPDPFRCAQSLLLRTPDEQTQDLENALRFRCSEDKGRSSWQAKDFSPSHRFLVSDWWAAT